MQHTLKQSYTFSGKGLHTGLMANMTVHPAPAGSGIRFVRSDISMETFIDALAINVGSTARSTTIASGAASVSTIEHLMSAAAGLGIDNMLVEIDSPEVPILDGSAKPYVEAFLADGLQPQQGERRTLGIRKPFHWEDPENGASIDILPSERTTMQLTVDFNSRVLGVQKFEYTDAVDYATQIAPCRTFCFLHELEFMVARGLVRGGDMNNAIVVVEQMISPESMERMKAFFGVGDLKVSEGYLNNLQLYFPDEIVRHKMLDMIGDFALLGAPLQGTIIASKTGHRANTAVCKSLLESDLLY